MAYEYFISYLKGINDYIEKCKTGPPHRDKDTWIRLAEQKKKWLIECYFHDLAQGTQNGTD